MRTILLLVLVACGCAVDGPDAPDAGDAPIECAGCDGWSCTAAGDCACDNGATCGGVDASGSRVFGSWLLQFDGSPCGGTVDRREWTQIDLAAGWPAVTQWRRDLADQRVELHHDGALVEMTATTPDETVWLDLVDVAGEAPVASVTWRTQLADGVCEMGPVEATIVARTRE